MHTNRNIGLPYKQFSKATDIRSFFSKKIFADNLLIHNNGYLFVSI